MTMSIIESSPQGPEWIEEKNYTKLIMPYACKRVTIFLRNKHPLSHHGPHDMSSWFVQIAYQTIN